MHALLIALVPAAIVLWLGVTSGSRAKLTAYACAGAAVGVFTGNPAFAVIDIAAVALAWWVGIQYLKSNSAPPVGQRTSSTLTPASAPGASPLAPRQLPTPVEHPDNAGSRWDGPDKRVYYVRLNTPVGPLYKLGFTTHASVRERLQYKGLGNEKLLARVFAFVPSGNAYSIEQTLHRHFGHRAIFPRPEEDMPLFNDGQSELYAEDILRLDSMYTLEQSQHVHACIMAARMKRAGRSPTEIDKALSERKELDSLESNLRAVASSNRGLIQRVKSLHAVIFKTGAERSKEEEIRRLTGWIRHDAKAMHEALWIDRQKRQERIRALQRKLNGLPEEAPRQPGPSTVPAEPPSAARNALAALTARDLPRFERLVDIDASMYALAEAMTKHGTNSMAMLSDYAGIANNLRLFDLMDKIFAEGREALLQPIATSYATAFRHWVSTGELLSENLLLPSDPVYFVTDEARLAESPLSDWYAPRVYLETLGRHWSTPSQFTAWGVDWACCEVHVLNSRTGFQGQFTIHAHSWRGGKLELDFDDFVALERGASEHERRFEERLGGSSGVVVSASRSNTEAASNQTNSDSVLDDVLDDGIPF